MNGVRVVQRCIKIHVLKSGAKSMSGKDRHKQAVVKHFIISWISMSRNTAQVVCLLI